MADSLASQIITAIGGPENVRSLTHCATRLRFELADASKVDQNALEHMKGVLGAVPQSGDRFQVVIGGGVATVYENIMHLPEMANAGAASASGEGQKSNADVKAEARSKARGKVAWLDSFFEYLADSFRPILGVLLGASIIIALVNLLISLNVIPNDEASAGWVFVKAIWKGVFYFLPIFLAYCAGSKFGAKPFISMAIASALVYPNITALFSATDPIAVDFFGIPVHMISYTSSVLPIIAACFVQAKLEKLLNRVIPKMLRGIFIPVLDLLILVPLTFIVVGPVTDILGNGLSTIIEAGMHLCPPLGGFLMAALWPGMIIFGIHWAFVPIALNNLAVLGYDYLLPLTVGCNFGIAAACLAVFLKTKNKELKEIAGPDVISALIGGVTEPAVYGVLLKFKKPMVIVCLVNGIGGAICGIFNVTRNVQMSVNLLTIPAVWAVYGPWGVVAIVVSFVGSFALTWLFGYSDKMLEKESK